MTPLVSNFILDIIIIDFKSHFIITLVSNLILDIIVNDLKSHDNISFESCSRQQFAVGGHCSVFARSSYVNYTAKVEMSHSCQSLTTNWGTICCTNTRIMSTSVSLSHREKSENKVKLVCLFEKYRLSTL